MKKRYTEEQIVKILAEGIHIDPIENGKIAKRWACNNFSELFAKLRTHS